MKAGTYRGVQIVGCYTGESKEKKTPFFTVEFHIVKENQYMDWTIYLKDDTAEAIERAKKAITTLRKCGFKGRSIADMSNTSTPLNQLFGAPVEEIELEIEDQPIMTKDENTGLEKQAIDSLGNPKFRQVIKWVNVGGASKFDHQQAVARFSSLKFDSILNGIAIASTAPLQQDSKPATAAGGSGLFSAPTSQQQGNTFANDDIPF